MQVAGALRGRSRGRVRVEVVLEAAGEWLGWRPCRWSPCRRSPCRRSDLARIWLAECGCRNLDHVFRLQLLPGAARGVDQTSWQTMTFIPAAQLKFQKSATSHEFSKESILLTFSGSEKLRCCWIREAIMWPLFSAGSSIQQRSWHSSNRNSSKTKCYLHALHFSVAWQNSMRGC